jgi:hypothetical protein
MVFAFSVALSICCRAPTSQRLPNPEIRRKLRSRRKAPRGHLLRKFPKNPVERGRQSGLNPLCRPFHTRPATPWRGTARPRRLLRHGLFRFA